MTMSQNVVAGNGADVPKLPRLSWIDPVYSWANTWVLNPFFPEPNDDHPPSDVLRGQELMQYIYNALTAVPEVWEKTVFIVSYDEHGGFYDHVLPPILHEDERVPSDQEFSRRGPRVPAMIISPYAEKGAVRGHMPEEIYDHCSILKFLCDWLGIPPFTARIRSRHVRSVADLLTDQKRTAIPVAPPLPDLKRPPHTYSVDVALSTVPVEEMALQPHNLALILENLRLQIEQEYPAEYKRYFPDLHGVPPIHTIAPKLMEP
jgi:phospholipase C